ncbi:hypothetical protein ACIBF1_37495 [Spirillospora sp. NPDC050679]
MQDKQDSWPGRWREPYKSGDSMWRVELRRKLSRWEEEAGLLRVLIAPTEDELMAMQVRQDELAAKVASPPPVPSPHRSR